MFVPLNVSISAHLSQRYMTDFVPLMKTDTNKLEDGVKIVDHVESFQGCIPLVSRIDGDGQTSITLSWLKKRWPETLGTCVETRAIQFI